MRPWIRAALASGSLLVTIPEGLGSGAQDWPVPLACYLDGVNTANLEATVACFEEAAIVDDVGRKFVGLNAIRGWLDNEVMDGALEIESCEVSENQSRLNCIVHFSPAGSAGFRARYIFETRGNQIVAMTLRYLEDGQ